MRLLNVHTFDFKEFPDGDRPPYVITSHRWKGGDEAMLDDIVTRRNTETSGYKKIEGFAKYTRENLPSIDWLWIDTCCIKQDNAVELQRSINSMFRWYLEAEVCIAYLSDVFSAGNQRAFEDSVWFKRGWTLQELLASRFLIFVSDEWDVIGHKGVQPDGWNSVIEIGPSLETQISTITNIGAGIIHDFKPLEGYSVEEALAWMEKRETYLPEDKSYSLFGIFKVNTWLNYGEGGEDARSRLLAEITNSSMTFHSVPLSSVENYTDRCALSEKLAIKLQNPMSNKNLARGATVVGLSGTGKTQLVLNYIERHKREYNAILWIDAQSKDIVLSSFQRCCHTLNLTVNAAQDNYGTLLRDQPHIQAVLRWLEGRSTEQPWLVVIDNADDLTIGIKEVIPRGDAGSVVITSQDYQTSFLLGGLEARIEVDEMERHEAMDLLYALLGHHAPLESTEKIVDMLGRLPFAIHLAAARMIVDIEDNRSTAVDAMQVYLSDFDRHKQDLLNDETFVGLTPYGKTVLTAWNTTLRSVKEISDQSGNFAYEFLIFLTLFNPTHIHEEIFRLASQSSDMECFGSTRAVLPWLYKVLSRGSDAKWYDFHYRDAVRPLVRYGSIRRVEDGQKGFKMHSLVHWRASQDTGQNDFRQSYILLLVSAIQGAAEMPTDMSMISMHLPSAHNMVEESHIADPVVECQAWSQLGLCLMSVRRHGEACHLLSATYRKLEKLLGKSHYLTLRARIHLATEYLCVEEYHLADELNMRNVELFDETVPRHCEMIKQSLELLIVNTSQRSPQSKAQLDGLIMKLQSKIRRTRTNGTDTQILMAISQQLRGQLEDSETQLHEQLNRTTDLKRRLMLMDALAALYKNQERWKDFEEIYPRTNSLCLQLYGAESDRFRRRCDELISINGQMGRWEEAQTLYCESSWARRRHADSRGCEGSPLCQASSLGDLTAVNLLLAMKGDKGSTLAEITCALMTATHRGRFNAVRSLVDHLGGVMAVTELYWEGSTALGAAAAEGHANIAQFFLKNGADVNGLANEQGTNLLQIACGRNQSSVVRILLASGAKSATACPQGWVALHYACIGGHPDIVHILIESGVDIETRTNEGATPLILAAQYGRTSVCQALLDANADFTAKDGEGFKALYWAMYGDYTDIVMMLFGKGASLNLAEDVVPRQINRNKPWELSNSILSETTRQDWLRATPGDYNAGPSISVRDDESLQSLHTPPLPPIIESDRGRFFGALPLTKIKSNNVEGNSPNAGPAVSFAEASVQGSGDERRDDLD